VIKYPDSWPCSLAEIERLHRNFSEWLDLLIRLRISNHKMMGSRIRKRLLVQSEKSWGLELGISAAEFVNSDRSSNADVYGIKFPYYSDSVLHSMYSSSVFLRIIHFRSAFIFQHMYSFLLKYQTFSRGRKSNASALLTELKKFQTSNTVHKEQK